MTITVSPWEKGRTGRNVTVRSSSEKENVPCTVPLHRANAQNVRSGTIVSRFTGRSKRTTIGVLTGASLTPGSGETDSTRIRWASADGSATIAATLAAGIHEMQYRRMTSLLRFRRLPPAREGPDRLQYTTGRRRPGLPARQGRGNVTGTFDRWRSSDALPCPTLRRIGMLPTA
ncbi:MAG: hypothetical protein AMXMBFR22_25780 [Phycisphaerae bacterium]